MGLESNQEIFFRDAFRDARAAAHKDAEGFQEILFALERFGAYLHKKPTKKPAKKSAKKPPSGLDAYRGEIATEADKSPLAKLVPDKCSQYHLRFPDLYESVLQGRNDALHQGAVARHLTEHAVALAIIIEDALMTDYKKRLSSYMVRGVTCAEPWQPVSFARQQMLVNSFSYLPILINNKWHLLSDSNIAKYIRHNGADTDEKKARLICEIQEAMKAVDNALMVNAANTCFHKKDEITDKITNDLLKLLAEGPILVVDDADPPQLLGIVTAFDLL